MSLDIMVQGHDEMPDLALDLPLGRTVVTEHDEYFNRHKLLQYWRALFRAIAREKPPDPHDFLLHQLQALQQGGTPRPATSETIFAATPGCAELSVIRAEGFPEGSILSIRLGSEKHQGDVRTVLREKMRFSP